MVFASLIRCDALSEKWVFCIVDDDWVSGVVVGVGLVSIVDEIGVFSEQVQKKRAGATR